MFELAHIRRRMATHSPQLGQIGAQTRQAAVAIVVRARPGGPDVLFIERAEKEGDPWSGQMAFPGGHKDPVDDDLKSAAMRETLEEISLDLSGAHYLGALDHQQARPRGHNLDMIIAPHVFEISGDPVLEPNYEVADTVWAPLNSLVTNTLHDWMTFELRGEPTIFNGYRLSGGHFVWGLTYRVLKDFFTTLNPSWQPPAER